MCNSLHIPSPSHIIMTQPTHSSRCFLLTLTGLITTLYVHNVGWWHHCHTFTLAGGFTLSPHYNRLLSVIRMPLAWVYPISAPVTSSVARLHHVSHADKRGHVCVLEWKQEDRRYVSGAHRYLSERDERRLQHCTHVISQLDEKTVFERESFWKHR